MGTDPRLTRVRLSPSPPRWSLNYIPPTGTVLLFPLHNEQTEVWEKEVTCPGSREQRAEPRPDPHGVSLCCSGPPRPPPRSSQQVGGLSTSPLGPGPQGVGVAGQGRGHPLPTASNTGTCNNLERGSWKISPLRCSQSGRGSSPEESSRRPPREDSTPSLPRSRRAS